MTSDVDIAVGRPAAIGGGMREVLRASGFNEEMSGEARPPVTYYHLGSPQEPFDVEFLTPLAGSENRRGAVIRSRFSNSNDRIRGAAAIAGAVGRGLPAQSLLEACQVGLGYVFA